ncbi:T9SS type A sorting domain-containing protein [Ferruginibacter sp. SUN002]|uniref:T9SS type A sorting domain-containing protein n=1 Tax=Ferruginibacter sp. SUN002 TaxID=2937789 RepID=UPI003D36C918
MKKTLPLLSLLFSLIAVSVSAQNLITNGDFESGGAGTGFTTNYFLTSGPSVQRNYAIVSNPNTINPVWSSACVDHTSGTGKMMVVDGASSSGDKIWEQQPGGGIPVTSGTEYTFSYWIQSISTTNATANLANIEVRVNNTVMTPTTGSTICPETLCGWTKVTYKWTATSGFAQIWLYDKTTVATGNDFALDDLSLVATPPPLAVSYAVIDPSCPNSSDGVISVYATGGVPPYTYSLNNGVFSSNSVFTGLAASTGNFVAVRDASSPTPTSVNSSATINVVAPTNPLTVRSDTTIDAGATVILNATGSNGSYAWVAVPADATLTSPNTANPTVNPLVTTTYTVTTPNTSVQNFIANPGFESGNVGFTSSYTFYTNTTNQKAYGITTDPQLFDNFFVSTTDHSGTGNMMVIDGSTQNSGNDIFWSQTIPVTQNTDYTFSYWLQTVATPNPAQIQTLINGAPITGNLFTSIATATATPTGWSQISYNWNSGSSTTAVISMNDFTTDATGNDFAIDDIVFSKPVACSLSRSVVVTVNDIAPVELVSLSAEWQDNSQTNAIVRWQTVTEIGTSYFVVERSTDGIHFTNAGTQAGAGNSNTALNYKLTDNDLSTLSTIFYYRLKEVDVNGNISYSRVVSIKRNPNIGRITISPNPTTGIIYLSNGQPIKAFIVYDAIGRKIYAAKEEINNSRRINLSNLSSGVYVYAVIYKDNRTENGKVIIKRSN